MDKKRNIPYFKNTIRKWIIILVGVAFTPMILITGIVLHRFHSYAHDQIASRLEELVLRHTRQIDFLLNENLKAVKHLANIIEPVRFDDDGYLRERLEDLRKEYTVDFMNLGFFDENGRQRSYAGPLAMKEVFYGNTVWFKQTIEKGYYISDVFIDAEAKPHYIVAAKIQKENAPWVLRASVEFGSINSIIENLKEGKTGKAFIVNKEGAFQAGFQNRININGKNYTDLFNTLPRNKPAKDNDNQTSHSHIRKWNDYQYSESGSILSVEKTKDSKSQIIIAAAFLKNHEWLLVFQQDFDEVFGDLTFSRNFSVMGILLGSFGIIFVGLSLFRRITKLISEVTTEKEMVMTQQIIETGKLDSIGELATGIAHEINNPVAIMVEEAGWVQDLLHEGIGINDNKEELVRALKQIETQGRRCKEITRKLLSFGRTTDSRTEKLRFNDLIEDVVSLSLEKARHANVKIYTDLDPDLPEIQASFNEMQQVLTNLVNNGLDAMEIKGDRLDIISAFSEEHITITVRDNGPGIAAINLNRVFDPFFTTKPVGKGSGLGLSICYGIIKKMGGRIDFESVEGEGSAFHMVLPIHST